MGLSKKSFRSPTTAPLLRPSQHVTWHRSCILAFNVIWNCFLDSIVTAVISPWDEKPHDNCWMCVWPSSHWRHLNLTFLAPQSVSFPERYKRKCKARKHAWCTEKTLSLMEHVRSGLQRFMPEISHAQLPMGRQTRSSGEPSRADVNRRQTTLWHAGDRQYTQSIPIQCRKAFAAASLC